MAEDRSGHELRELVVDSLLPAAFLLAGLLLIFLLPAYFSSDPAGWAKQLSQFMRLFGLFLLAMIAVLLAQILSCLRKIRDRAAHN